MNAFRFGKRYFVFWLKTELAAVLYPALLQAELLPAGPDGIRQERPHLLVVLEALENIQVYVLAVRPVSPSHGLSPCATY
jgi:hypothetical protein